MRQLAFWDTSVLVPLCVPQASTPFVTKFSRSYDVVVWWATPVELAAAFARLVGMQAIDANDLAEANRLATALAIWWIAIRPSENLRARAVLLVDRYDLRAADALQLSAGMEWCNNDPKGRVFLTADRRLRQAAQLSGFDAPPIA